MSDISILNFTDENLKNKTIPVLQSWSEKGFLRNFLTLEKFNHDSNEYQSYECIDGEYLQIEDIKRRLESVQYQTIRIVNITSPTSAPPDFEGIKSFLRAPSNISIVSLNLIIPLTSWYKNKSITSGTTFANANILISPRDRSNPLRVPIDIEEDNYFHHISITAVITGSIWRGMEKGPFDDQKRNQQGNIDFIIARFFTRLLLGPDPIVGILDTLTNENGKWITPHQDYTRPSDDFVEVSRFSNMVIEKYFDLFNYESYKDFKSQKNITFFNFFRNRYSSVTFSEPLPMLSSLIDSSDILKEIISEDTTTDNIIEKTDDLVKINDINKEIFKELSGQVTINNQSFGENKTNNFFIYRWIRITNWIWKHERKIVLNNPKSIVAKKELFKLYTRKTNPEDTQKDCSISQRAKKIKQAMKIHFWKFYKIYTKTNIFCIR